MPRIQYKEKCKKCRKNWVLVDRRNDFIICYECQKDELHQPIESERMQKFFDIPEDYYKKNMFLRNIKINYIRYGQLSPKQMEAFEKTVEKIKEAESQSE